MIKIPSDKVYDPEIYARNYNAEYEFEYYITRARQDSALRVLKQRRPSYLLEIGCGPNVLADRAGEISFCPVRWQVVEPAETYAEPARAQMADRTWFQIMLGYFEDSADKLSKLAPQGYDGILISGLLHETSKPERMLAIARSLLSDAGWILVCVPNANSFHRLLAVEMGLIPSTRVLSSRNVALGQGVVYAPEDIEELLRKSGYRAVEFSGHMFKPFTNDQMHALRQILGNDMIAGLDKLGQKFPGNASEFSFVAQKAE